MKKLIIPLTLLLLLFPCLCSAQFESKDGVEVSTGTGTGDIESVGDCTTGDCTAGIADNNVVQIDDSDATDNDYAKFTASGLEGRSYSEVRQDLGIDTAANLETSLSLGAYASDILGAADSDALVTLLGLVAGDIPDLTSIYLSLGGGTLTGEVKADDLGFEFTAGDTLTDCSTFSATGGGIFYDDSEGKFKKCQDNVLSDLDTHLSLTTIDSDYGTETVSVIWTITGNWVNTTNPWADNEVADDITASNYLPLAGGTLTGALKISNGQTIEPALSTDGHTLIIRAYGTDGVGDPAIYNLMTITNDSSGGNNHLPEVTFENGDFSFPALTGDLSTTGFMNGGARPVSIAACEGYTEDGGADSNTIATDSGESLTVDAYIGMTIYNTTDVSSCTVTDNNGTTWTCDGLTGGTDNLFQNGDAIALGPGPRQSGSMFYISASTTILHPATVGYMAGYFADGAYTIKVDPQSDAMSINFSDDGVYTDPGAGDEIDGDGSEGDYIVIHNKSATEARSLGVVGSWADGGAS